MALAFVNRAECTVNSSSLPSAATAAISHTAGNLLVVCVNFQTGGGATSVTLSDTAGNTWNPIGSLLVRGNNRLQQWECHNCLGNASNIVTATTVGGNSQFLVVSVLQFSGENTSSPLEASPASATGSSASINSGSVVVTASSAVIVAFMEADNKNLVGGTGYTLTVFGGTNGGFFADEYHIVTASEAATATCGSGAWGVVAAAFKVASGAGASGNNLLGEGTLVGAGRLMGEGVLVC